MSRFLTTRIGLTLNSMALLGIFGLSGCNHPEVRPLGTSSGTQSPLHSETPPAAVPDHLSAKEYYQLGVRYKTAGWTEEARDALNRAIHDDPLGVGKKASIYLKAYIPRFPVPHEAVKKNVAGYNEMVSKHDDAAIPIFEECIKQYPHFEWPYGNLATIYIRQDKTGKAMVLLNQALKFNPNYVKGWICLAHAHLHVNNNTAATDCLKKALEIDPDNKDAQETLQRLSKS